MRLRNGRAALLGLVLAGGIAGCSDDQEAVAPAASDLSRVVPARVPSGLSIDR